MKYEVRKAILKTKVQDFITEVKRVTRVMSLVTLGMIIGGNGVYVYSHYEILLERDIRTYTATPQAHASEVTEVKEVVPAIQWKKAEFSAYNAEVGQTDSDPLTMASGKKVYEGAIACPRDIKLGSIIVVENMGEYTCEDRLNIRYTNNFDIFMHSHTDALKFGRKMINYYVK